MCIWCVGFDYIVVLEIDFLAYFNCMFGIFVVQFNYLVELWSIVLDDLEF